MSDQAGTPGIANLIEPHPVTTCGNIRYQIHGKFRRSYSGLFKKHIWKYFSFPIIPERENGRFDIMKIQRIAKLNQNQIHLDEALYNLKKNRSFKNKPVILDSVKKEMQNNFKIFQITPV